MIDRIESERAARRKASAFDGLLRAGKIDNRTADTFLAAGEAHVSRLERVRGRRFATVRTTIIRQRTKSGIELTTEVQR